jgi:hypothetical protein
MSRIMARKCLLYADSLENVDAYQTFRVKALDAIKNFSHWLHERNESTVKWDEVRDDDDYDVPYE